MEAQSCILPNVQYVQVTKLVNGYMPVTVFVNPAAVAYVEPRFASQGRRQVEKGARIFLGVAAESFIDVQQSVDEVMVRLYERLGVFRG